MFPENQPRQLDEQGSLGPIRDICVVAAQRTYLKRKNTDKVPEIVQMILRGELIPHWYYRSGEWIDQPYFFPLAFITPYRGPIESAIPLLYGIGTYIVDSELMRLTERGFVINQVPT